MAGLDFFDFCLPGRPAAGIILTMLACLDGGKRLCGEVDANISTGRPGKFGPCWRASTEVKGFAGKSTPT